MRVRHVSVRHVSLGLAASAATSAVTSALAASLASAQVAPAGAAPAASAIPGCTYDTCALRRERVFFAERVLAGREGRVVGRPGVFGVVPAAELVRAVPEAVPYAQRYQREARLGGALTTAGTILGLVAFVDAIRTRNGTCRIISEVTTVTATGATTRRESECRIGNYDRQLGLAIGGLVVGGVGGWRLQVADRALNRSLWYYNRALAR